MLPTTMHMFMKYGHKWKREYRLREFDKKVLKKNLRLEKKEGFVNEYWQLVVKCLEEDPQ